MTATAAPLVRLVEPRAIVHEHAALMMAMRLESGFNSTDVETYLNGPIVRCAAYVHQIPASRAEHHRETGGMIRFCLEVAVNAFRRADGTLFGAIGARTGRAARDASWRYAAFLAGLVHGTGVAAAVDVSDEESGLLWNAYSSPLYDWARSNGVHDYRIDWRSAPGRGSTLSARSWFASKIIDARALERVGQGGGNVLETLVAVINGRSEHTLSELVEGSAGAVVDQDLSVLREAASLPLLGLRAEQCVLDAIRSLIRDKWTCNQAGARVWVTTEGVFINWQPAVNDIGVRITSGGTVGMLKTPDGIAELLLEHQIIERNPSPANGREPAHYFLVTMDAPKIPKAPLKCVKIANPDGLGLRLNEIEVIKASVAGDATRQPVDPSPWKEASVEALQHTTPSRAAQGPAGDQHEHIAIAMPTLNCSNEEDEPTHEAGETATEEPLALRSPEPIFDAEQEPLASREQQHQERGASEHDPVAVPELQRYGSAGDVLIKLARLDNGAFVKVPGGVAVGHPTTLVEVCTSPRDFITACQTQGMLVAPKGKRGGLPVHNRSATERNSALPERYIVFNERIAQALGYPGTTV